MENKLLPTDKILAIDIGGSHIKTILLDFEGKHLEERRRTPTPNPSTPAAVIEIIKNLASQTTGYTKASAGFPALLKTM